METRPPSLTGYFLPWPLGLASLALVLGLKAGMSAVSEGRISSLTLKYNQINCHSPL